MKTRAIFQISVVLIASLVLLGTARPSPRTFYEQGRRAYEGGDYRMAVERFNQAIEANPAYQKAIQALGESYQKIGEYEQARGAFGRLLAQDDKNLAAQIGMARAQLALGDLAGVSEQLERAALQDPGSHAVQLLRAELNMARNRPGLALRYYERILRGNPGNADALRGAALAASRLGRFALASKYVRRARMLQPVNPDVHRTLGSVRLQEALDMPPGTERQAALEAADESLRTALQLSPNDPELEMRLLWLQVYQGKMDSAIQQARRLQVELTPAVFARYLPAYVLINAPVEEQRYGVSALRSLLQITPEDSLARFRLESYVLQHPQRFGARGALRSNLAAYHRERVRYYDARRLTDQRDLHLARSLKLGSADDSLLRRKLELANVQGDFGTFVNVLQTLVSQNPLDVKLRYRLETALRRRGSDLEYAAKQRLGRIQRSGTGVFFFDLKASSSTPYHPDGGQLLAQALLEQSHSVGRIQAVSSKVRQRVVSELTTAGGQSDFGGFTFSAGRLARASTVDGMKSVALFVGGSYASGPQSIDATFEVYEANSGRRLLRFSLSAQGRDAVHELSARAVRRISAIAAARARVLEVTADGILLSGGIVDGLALKSRMIIYGQEVGDLPLVEGELQARLAKKIQAPRYCQISRVASHVALCVPEDKDEDAFHAGEFAVLLPPAKKQ